MLTLLLATLVHCYAGCNTGSSDRQALHLLECDTETGAAKIVQSVTNLQGTTYFQLDADGKWLYSIVGDERDRKRHSKAVRFRVDGGRIGEMQVLADLPCSAPCHVTLSNDGRQMAFAAYGAATAGVLPVEGGAVKSAVLSDEGVGPNKKRQQKAFAHCAFYTPDGSRLGIVNLGCDRIHFFDPKTMEEDKGMTIRTDPGDGPRHAIWSNDRRFLFLVNELGSSVMSFAYDGKRTFARVGKWTMLPADFKVWDSDGLTLASKASAIKLTQDGKVLIASNRGHDSIAFYDVDAATGTLTLRNVAKLVGTFPRDFELMPGEKFMVVGNETGNSIQIYRFDRAAYSLTPVGAPIPAWMPLCFKFRECK